MGRLDSDGYGYTRGYGSGRVVILSTGRVRVRSCATGTGRVAKMLYPQTPTPLPSRSSGARNCSSWNYTWGEGQRRTLQECSVDGEDVASDLGDVKRLLHYPAGPRPTAHRAKDTIALLRRETPSFIGPNLWPATSQDFNPVEFEFYTGTRLPDSNTGHRRVEEAPHRC